MIILCVGFVVYAQADTTENAVIELAFNDGSTDLTIIVNFVGATAEEVDGDPEEIEQDTGVGEENEVQNPGLNPSEEEEEDGDDDGGGSDPGDTTGNTPSGTPESDQLITASATEYKAQPQTTTGGGGSGDDTPGDDDNPDYSEEEVDAGTGAAYRKNYPASLSLIGEGNPLKPIDLTTSIGGMVWEDAEEGDKGEELSADGIYKEDSKDEKLENIEVVIWKVIYEKSTDSAGNVTYTEVTSGDYARTYADAYRTKTIADNGSVTLEDKIDFSSSVRADRLFTDENGDYLAYLNIPAVEGLDTSKYKVSYDVEFIYDGQTYEVTEYLVSENEDADATVGDTVSETIKNRLEKFESLSDTDSSDGNASTIDYSEYENSSYAVESSDDRSDFNDKFTEVFGDTDIDADGDGTTTGKSKSLDADGDGESEEYSLTYSSEDKSSDSGVETENSTTRKISTLETEEVDENDEETYVNETFWMTARTSTAGLLLPYESLIRVDDMTITEGTKSTEELMKEYAFIDYDQDAGSGTYTYYKPITQYFNQINLGLVQRDETDASVSQDLYKAEVTVNQDTVTYKYSKYTDYSLSEGTDKLNMLIDLQNKYASYELGLYQSDFYYRSSVYSTDDTEEVIKELLYDTKSNSELRVFASYVITVYNDSDSQDMSINNLYEYYDSTYTLVDDLEGGETDYDTETDGIQTKIADEEGNISLQTVAENSYFRIYKQYSENTGSKYKYSAEGDTSSDLKLTRADEDTAMLTGTVTWDTESETLDSDSNPLGYKLMTTRFFKATEADTGATYETNELTLAPGEMLEIFVTFEVDNEGFVDATAEKSEDENGEEQLSYLDSTETKYAMREDMLGGKNVLAEIANYTTFYTEDSLKKNNTIAYEAGQVSGKVDKDSAPDNANLTVTESMTIKDEDENDVEYTVLDKTWLDDDSDTSPMFRIYLRGQASDRSISGTVFEDSRDTDVTIDGDSTNTKVGNGTYDVSDDSDDNPIEGATVTLVEKIKINSGTDEQLEYEFVWPDDSFGSDYDFTSVTMSDGNGEYTIENFVAGDYVVRYEYGNTLLTLQYNGQDYKNTSYQEGITNPNKDTITDNYAEENMNNDNRYVDSNDDGENDDEKSLIDQETLNNEWHDTTGLTTGGTNNENEVRSSDARDDEARRLEVDSYSNTITNELAELYALADSEYLEEMQEKVKEEMATSNDLYKKAYDTVAKEYKNQYDTLQNKISNNETLTEDEEAEYEKLKEIVSIINNLDTLTTITAMEANTAKISVKLEDSSTVDFTSKKSSVEGTYILYSNGDPSKVVAGDKSFVVENIDFGIEQRADTVIQLDKAITHIALTKNGSTEFEVYVNEDGSIDEATAKNYNELLNLSESNGVQGFKYIQMDSEYLLGMTVTIDYDIKVTNKSEVDFGATDVLTDANTYDTYKKYIYEASHLVYDSDVNTYEYTNTGEYNTYGTYAGLYYYTHNVDAVGAGEEECKYAKEYYSDVAVTTTVNQIIDYIDPDTSVSSTSEEDWSTSYASAEGGVKSEKLDNGLLSDDSYTIENTDGTVKYYLADKDSDLYETNVVASAVDGYIKVVEELTIKVLERGDNGEGQLSYIGDDEVIGHKAISGSTTLIDRYEYDLDDNNAIRKTATTETQNLTQALTTINLPTSATDDSDVCSSNISIETAVTINNTENITDMNYNNLAEVLVYSNTVGRRTMYAIPGNAFEIAKIDITDESTEDSVNTKVGGGIWNAGHSSNESKDDGTYIDSSSYSDYVEYQATNKYVIDTKNLMNKTDSSTTYVYVAELDADAADYVTFTLPTGLSLAQQNQTILIIVMLIALVILAAGIILITVRVVMVKSTDDVVIKSTKE